MWWGFMSREMWNLRAPGVWSARTLIWSQQGERPGVLVWVLISKFLRELYGCTYVYNVYTCGNYIRIFIDWAVLIHLSLVENKGAWLQCVTSFYFSHKRPTGTTDTTSQHSSQPYSHSNTYDTIFAFSECTKYWMNIYYELENWTTTCSL